MTKLIDAMKSVNDLNRTHGVTQRGGKKYTEVFVRVEQFRMAFGETLGIDTNILVDDGKRVVVKATVTKDGMIIGSGMAEEIRGSSNVNKTSALENCETSAIGRALASLGLHGGSYASANEIAAVQRKEQAMQEQVQAPQERQEEIKQEFKDAMVGAFGVQAHEVQDDEPVDPSAYQAYWHDGTKAGGPEPDAEAYREKIIAIIRKYTNAGKSKKQVQALWDANFALIDTLGEANRSQIDNTFKLNMRVAKDT